MKPSARPEKPAPDFPLFAHAAGQWAKKIQGKTIYFGAWHDPEGALRRYHDSLSDKTPKPASNRQPAEKPYAEFPLFRHATGQWAKKIRGRLHYFGTDADVALAKYLDQKDDLHAGRSPRGADAGLVLGDLCNRYLTEKKNLMESGEFSPRTWRDYFRVCENLTQHWGRNRLVTDLHPEDFSRLRATLAQRRGPVGLANEIQRIRTMFKFAYDEGLIDRPIRYGSTFKKPNRKAMREARQARGSRMLEADELRKIIDAAGTPTRAMILLGLNCGFGQTDVADLPIEAIDFAAGFIDFPRPKTAIPRRIPLWPETVAALHEALEDRPTPKAAADAGLVFITMHGNRWVKIKMHESGKAVHVDSVRLEYGKVLDGLKIKRAGGFYNLRHVHRTVADAIRDQPAIDAIMGHQREGDMSVHYRERMDDDRLRAVVNCVREWLWPVKATKKAKSRPAAEKAAK